MVSVPNFMQGAGGSYPSTLPQLNLGQLLAFMKSLNGKPNPFFCSSLPCSTPFDFSQTLPQANPYNSYDVTEKTFSLYGEMTFAGTDWGGNLGLRIVRTNTTASTAIAAPTSLWTPSINSSTETWNVQYPAGQESITEGHYILPLPAANFNYWVVPQKVQLRAAVAETMSRPDLDELAPTSYNNAENGQPQLYYGGTAGLKPIKATQVDFSAEWYYRPHAALTAALFGKKIRDDIYTATIANVNLGTLQYIGGPPGGENSGHALPVDRPRTGQRRQEHFLWHRARVATHHGQWLGSPFCSTRAPKTRATIRTAIASAQLMRYHPRPCRLDCCMKRVPSAPT